MFEKFALNLAIPFVFRQLRKFGERIDWSKVEHDLEKRVKDLMPGEVFDDTAADLLSSAMHTIKRALGQEDTLKDVIGLLFDEKWEAALDMLKGIALHSIGLAENGDEKVKEMFSNIV